MVRPIARILNKMGLTKNAGFLKFLEPFGVLIFVCRKYPVGKPMIRPRISPTAKDLLDTIS